MFQRAELVRLIPARRPASSSVNPLAMACAIVVTASGVRLVGRPSPILPRLLILCSGSLFTFLLLPCQESFFPPPIFTLVSLVSSISCFLTIGCRVELAVYWSRHVKESVTRS
jgi:hypothetical protein